MYGPALVFAFACSEWRLDPVDTDVPVDRVVLEDEFVQAALPAVDVLFVIDNTASMAQEQAALAAQLPDMIDALDAAGIDWHVGVVTTAMGTGDAGWLLGEPYVLDPTVDDADGRFAEVAQVGTSGTVEAGLAAAILTLDLTDPGLPNAGFRRPDASLHVVFVSDADDDSDDWLDDPTGSFLGMLDQEVARTGLGARASAICGDVPSGCTSTLGTAQAGVRYAEVVEASGGVLASICSDDFEPLLDKVAEASVTWRTVFELSSTPEAGTVEVDVDGVRQTDGWTLEDDPPAVRFEVAPPAESRIRVTYVVEVPG